MSTERMLASGSIALVDDAGKVILIFDPQDEDDSEWGPFCSICDGSGHGYPGAAPCPIEDDGRWYREDQW